jgi:chemotaxis protein methyltransferase CheR
MSALEAAEFAYVADLMRRRAGICLEPCKSYLVENRLQQLAPNVGFTSASHLIARLRSGPEEALHNRVVEAMLVHETFFFRDAAVYDCLKDVVLPRLLQGGRTVRIWCAACSRGQEPYSLAMLMHDEMPAALARVKIVASDLSADIITEARQGHYSQLEINRGLPARVLLRHFERDGIGWRIKEPIRRQVEFRRINLIGEWGDLRSLDVVLLRNVLIYFDLQTKRRILTRVGQLLAPGGILFLGGAETTVGLDEDLERVQIGKAIGYQRRSS